MLLQTHVRDYTETGESGSEMESPTVYSQDIVLVKGHTDMWHVYGLGSGPFGTSSRDLEMGT